MQGVNRGTGWSPAAFLRRRLRRRSMVVLLVALATASIPVALHVTVPEAAPRAAVAPAQSCGYDRWAVKTLQDRPELLPTTSSSVAALGVMPRPDSLTSTRLPQEHQVYAVTADVLDLEPQRDGDLHVILKAGGRTIIAEAPRLACVTDAGPLRRLQMQHVRDSLRLCRARVTGVLFFDFAAGQYGHAPNYAELHPILVFQCLSPLGAKPERRPPLKSLLPRWGGD